MSDTARLITARFAKIQSNREAATAATLASSDENRRATDAAGAAVHARARSRLSALSRRSTDRRQGWGTDDELVIGVIENEDEAPVEDVRLPRLSGPADDELQGRDWLR